MGVGMLKGAALISAKQRAVARFEMGERAPGVAQAIGVHESTVYAWRRKWLAGGTDLVLAGRPEKYAVEPMTARESSVLDGLMLGDGHLELLPNGRNPALRITRTAADLDYLNWTAEVFQARLTPTTISVVEAKDSRTGKHYQSARLRTRCDPAFRAPLRRWYPDGAKVVPPDLELSALTIAVWFADDGSVTASSRRSPEIKFATHGFNALDVHRLADLLAIRYAERFAVCPAGPAGQFVIRAFGKAAKAMLRDIDPVFPPLARKANRWRNTELLTDRVPAPPCPRCASERVYRWARTPKGVQQFKCLSCTRVFRENYERPGRNPRPVQEIAQ